MGLLIYNHPIGRKNTTYIPLIVLANWVVICYRSHLFKGTRFSLHWKPEPILQVPGLPSLAWPCAKYQVGWLSGIRRTQPLMDGLMAERCSSWIVVERLNSSSRIFFQWSSCRVRFLSDADVFFPPFFFWRSHQKFQRHNFFSIRMSSRLAPKPSWNIHEAYVASIFSSLNLPSSPHKKTCMFYSLALRIMRSQVTGGDWRSKRTLRHTDSKPSFWRVQSLILETWRNSLWPFLQEISNRTYWTDP